MAHKKKISLLLLLVFIIGAIASMPLSVSAAVSQSDASAGTFKVKVTSNLFGTQEKTYDASTKHIKVVYEVNMPGFSCANVDFKLNYDKDVFTYNTTQNSSSTICPIAGSYLVSETPVDKPYGEEGLISCTFNDITNSIKMYGNNAKFMSVILDVNDGAAKDTTIDLNVKTMRICDETKPLDMSTSVSVVKKSVVQLSDAELAKLNVNDYSEAISLPGDPDDNEFIVKTTSNLFGEHTQKYDPKQTKQIVVFYELNYPGYALYNGDFELTYDPNVLTYNKTLNTKSSICPAVSAYVQTTTPADQGYGTEGSVSGQFSEVNNRIKAYGTGGKPVVFLTVIFDVAANAKGTTVVNLDVKRLKIQDETKIDQEETVVKNSVVQMSGTQLSKLNLKDYSQAYGQTPTQPTTQTPTQPVTTHVHTVVTDKAVPATCTESGLTEGKHCSVCNEVIVKQQVVPALGHAEVIDKAVPASCTKTGLTEGKHCSRCNEVLVKQQVVSKTAHTVVVDKAVPATCTQSGLTEGSHCSVCNTVIKKQETVKALGHKEVIDKAVPATCTQSGLTQGSHCSVCNTIIKKQETVKALGHKEVIDKAVPATCTQPGLTQGSHCSVCNTVIKKQETVKALGHNVVIDKAVPATCTEVGYTQGSHCSRCNEVIVKQDVIPSKGHTPVIDEAVSATCKHTGLTTGLHCSVCNTVLIKQEVVPKLEHKVVVDKAVPASCTETGLTEGSHCSVCHEVIKAQKVVSALGHNYQIVKGKPATATSEGLTDGIKCTRCGEWLKKQEVIPKLGTEILIGDVNMDGKVNGIDSSILARYLSGWDGYDERIKSWEAADLDRNGTVNGKDSSILKRYLSAWDGYDKYIITVVV